MARFVLMREWAESLSAMVLIPNANNDSSEDEGGRAYFSGSVVVLLGRKDAQ